MKSTLIVGTEHGAMVVQQEREDDSLSFAGVLQALYDQRFTGSITLHFKDGKPALVEMPAPKVRLCRS